MIAATNLMTCPLPLAWIQGWEVVVLLIAVLILFGGKKLPELARGLGRSLRIFREEAKGLKDEMSQELDAPPAKKTDEKTDAQLHEVKKDEE